MGVAAETVALQPVAGGEGDDAIDAIAVAAILADHHVRVAAPFEILAYAGGQFVADPGAERVAGIHVPTGDLNFHAPTTRPLGKGVKPNVMTFR